MKPTFKPKRNGQGDEFNSLIPGFHQQQDIAPAAAFLRLTDCAVNVGRGTGVNV
jgi:hypothetical protein